MLTVRSPLSRNCLQVTVDRSSFCAAAGADAASGAATSDMATRMALMIFTIGVLNEHPARTTVYRRRGRRSKRLSMITLRLQRRRPVSQYRRLGWLQAEC